MSGPTTPWRGVTVATALPYRERDGDPLAVDLDAYADHLRWLAENGCDGVVPNGSLGEYQSLTPDERAAVVTTSCQVAAEIASRGTPFTVMPGVAGYGSREVCRWLDQAGEAGAPCALLLPPNAYRADETTVVDHYRAAASVGLPIVAYNNPHDTKVDLAPTLLARLHGEGLIVAVKEFSGDVRRAYELTELAPGLDLLAGSDDVVLELALAGAVGWVSGYPNAFPDACLRLWRASVAHDLDVALPLYRQLHPLLRWDSRTEFVQAIKLSMDLAGRCGGPCRPPRLSLTADVEAVVRTATRHALDAGLR